VASSVAMRSTQIAPWVATRAPAICLSRMVQNTVPPLALGEYIDRDS
jgi:hypothetical protein